MSETLTRTLPFTVERAEAVGDGLTLSGYAAVFNQTTRIDSWEGTFDEQIAPGAFKKTLQERTPVLQFDHGAHPLVGSLPIGSIDVLREDSRGLFVQATLHDNWLVQPVRDAIASGSIDGMSFRFAVVKDTFDESTRVPLRTLNEVKLYELGPVVFPAYEQTSVGVRSLDLAREIRALDADARADLARALMSDTADVQPGVELTDDAAVIADEPEFHSRHSIQQRRKRAAELRGISQ